MQTNRTRRWALTRAGGLTTQVVLAGLVGLVLLQAGVLGGEVADLPRAEREAVGMSSDRLARVTSTMQRYIDAEQLAGTVTLIARHGKVVHLEAQGWRDKEADAPMTSDTIFTIMSMTKPIVSTALMMLFEEGRFLLDDPISNWLPNYRDLDVRVGDETSSRRETADRPVSVRHVLTHTSGLSLHPDFQPSYGLASRLGNGAEPRTLEEAIVRAADRPLAFHPGDEWQYGDSTEYVALLVEKLSGMSLNSFLQQRLFQPLGMDDTHYYVPQSKVGRVAAVYRHQGPRHRIELFRAPQVQEPNRFFGGVAGLSSTVADYFLFHQMMLNGGTMNGMRFLSPRTINLMISNHSGDKEVDVWGPGYGFGLGYAVLLDPGRANEHLSPGSFLWSGAWNTIAWIDPVEDMLAVFMTQATPFGKVNVMRDLSTVASQAIVDSHRDTPPTVMGYQVLR
jgi:CubicO group peptidase (beta-lactamase class C family)